MFAILFAWFLKYCNYISSACLGQFQLLPFRQVLFILLYCLNFEENFTSLFRKDVISTLIFYPYVTKRCVANAEGNSTAF